MHRNYYEAIIQVRPRKREVEGFIASGLENTSKARLVKKKILKEGVDYYISSWKFAQSLGNKLAKRFGGTVVLSKKIFGISRKKRRVVYRSTILYRVPPFTRGDVVAQGGRILQITYVGKGKRVVGENLLSGKKEGVDAKKGLEKLKTYKTRVSAVYPELEVINPEDYQSIVV